MVTSGEVVWIDVLPSARGFGARMSKDLAGVGTKAGRQIERELDRATARAGIRVGENLSAGLDAAKDKAARLGDQLAAARNKEADAAGKVKVAEKAATEARARYGTESSKTLAAEERLASARRTQATATERVTSLVDKHAQAQRNATRASDQLRLSHDRVGTSLAAVSRGLRAIDDSPVRRAAGAMGSFVGVAGKAGAVGAALGGTVMTLSALAGAAATAAGAAVAIPGGLAIAGAAAGAFGVGLLGVTDALEAYSQAQDQAASGGAALARQQTAAARAIAGAREQLAQAQTSLTRANQDAAWSAAAAGRRVMEAEAEVRSAVQASARAQTDLTRARRDAAAAMRELSLAVRGGSLDEREARLGLLDAEQELAAARAKSATGADWERAVLGVDRARLAVDTAVDRNRDLADQQRQTARAGVAGSAQVVAAQDTVRDAQQRVLASEQGVRDARESGARDAIASARSVGDATHAVEQAQRQLTDAISDAALVGADSMAKVDAAMAELSPAGRDAVRTLQDLRGEFAPIKYAAQDALLGGVGGAMRQTAKVYFPLLETGLADINTGINTAGLSLLEMLRQADSVDTVAHLLDNTATATHNLSSAVSPLGQALLDVSAVGSDVLTEMTRDAGGTAAEFAAMVREMRESGQLEQIIQAGLHALAQLGHLAANVGSILVSIFQGSAVEGVSFLDTVVRITGTVADFLNSAQGIALMATFFGGVRAGAAAAQPLLAAVGQVLVTAILPALAQLLPLVGQALGALAPAIAPLGQLLSVLAPLIGQIAVILATQLAGALQTIIPWITQLVTWLSQSPGAAAAVVAGLAAIGVVAGPLASVFGALIGPYLAWKRLNVQVGADAAKSSGLLSRLGGAFRFLLGPVGLAIGIFAALFATNEQFRTAVLGILTVVGQLVAQLATSLAPILTQLASLFSALLTTAIMPIVTQLVSSLMPVILQVAGVTTQLLAALLPLLPPFIQLTSVLLPVLVALVRAAAPIVSLLAGLLAGALGFALRVILVPALTLAVGAVRVIGAVFTWLYEHVIAPVWAKLQPIFHLFGQAADAVGGAFERLGDKVAGIWQGLKNIVHDGIQGIVDLVYNNGIRKLANAVIKYIPGVDYLPEIRIPEFARGGVLPGYAPGRDTELIMASAGEGILVPELVRDIGPRTILAANAAAVAGRYAAGGIVGTNLATAGDTGGSSTAAASTPPTAATAVTIDPAALAALGAATETVTALVAALAVEITTVLVPTLAALDAHTVQTAAGIVAATFTTAAVVWARQQLLAIQLTGSWAHTAASIALALAASTHAQGVAFAATVAGLAGMRAAMAATASAAETQFSRVRTAAATPLRWVLQQPINAGLIAAWNQLNRDFALKTPVRPVPVPFAGGGLVRGPGTGTSDDVAALLSDREFVVRSAITRDTLPFLHALNNGQPEALQAAGAGRHTPRFARGGLVDVHGQRVGGALARGAAFARRESGKPYIWGAVGPDGYDCSGFMSAITNVLRGQDPHHRLGVARSQPWAGFRPGLGGPDGGAFATGYSDVHTAGTLAGVNVEAGGSPSRVKYGAGAVGADSPQFRGHAYLPLVGGRFVSGGVSGGDGAALDPGQLAAAAFRDAAGLASSTARRWPGNLAAVDGGRVAGKAIAAVQAAATRKLAAALTPTGAGGGGVEQWRGLVLQALARVGQPASLADTVLRRMAKESGGDPRAINNWDINARNGVPSKGLMQVIDPTFAAHRDPALSADIWDPMANVVASMRYGIDRYGSLPEAFNQPGGYDNGGPVQPGWTPVYNGGRRAENVLSDAQDQALAQRLRGDSEPKRITGTVRLSRDSEGLLLELVDARIDDANDRTGKALARLR